MRRISFPFLSLLFFLWAACFIGSGCRKTEQPPPPAEPGPAEMLTKILTDQGLDPQAIHQFRDLANGLHVKVELGLDAYAAIEPLLEKRLAEDAAVILKKEKSQEKDVAYFLWQVAGKNQDRLTVVFSCPPETKPAGPPPRKKAAIIVDDLGYSLEAVQILCSLKKPITLSILPFAPLTQKTAELARDAGLEMMLHLPLESLSRSAKKSPSEVMIFKGMNRDEIKRDVEACLQQIPWSKGVNNHTGSRITEDPGMMRVILEVLKDKGLYFIDSRTTRYSVAFDQALMLGVPSASRKVFIDAVDNGGAIQAKLEELFGLAREKGQAVGICHARPETLRALQKYVGLAKDYGVELVFASEVVGTKRGS
jgi:polysaccharide deacetylase 2 family uncharacterized protein YibQ